MHDFDIQSATPNLGHTRSDVPGVFDHALTPAKFNDMHMYSFRKPMRPRYWSNFCGHSTGLAGRCMNIERLGFRLLGLVLKPLGFPSPESQAPKGLPKP